MVLLMLVIGVVNILLAERLTVNNGLGWDGVLYGKWAKDFYNTVVVQGIPDYYTQRFLPSAIVHYSMRLFRVPFDNWHVIHAFDVYNLVLLVICSYVWGLTADRLSISNKGKWLGFFFLFLNYAILKNNVYHSVLTDTSAFTLGLLTFYFFLADNVAGLLIVILLGGFTWPTVPVLGAMLLVFPRSNPATSVNLATSVKLHPAREWPLLTKEPAPYRLNLWLAALTSLVFLLALLRLTDHRLTERIALFVGILRIDTAVVYLSVAAVVGYLFFGLLRLLDSRGLFNVRTLLQSVSWVRVIAVLPVLAGIVVLRHLVSNGEIAGWPSTSSFVIYTLLCSLTDPLIFLVSHVIYFGPAIILLVLFWRQFCESLRSFGPGMVAFMLANLFLSINPQSRFQINVAPVVLILIVSLGDRTFLKNQSLVFWFLLSVFYSKVWYKFNTAPQIDDGTMTSLLNFPLQHYFMNSGPWMSQKMYYVQGAVVLVTGVVIYVLTRSSRRANVRRASACRVEPNTDPTVILEP
jgi:hypothetical protein